MRLPLHCTSDGHVERHSALVVNAVDGGEASPSQEHQLLISRDVQFGIFVRSRFGIMIAEQENAVRPDRLMCLRKE